jgi:hypothetical protein
MTYEKATGKEELPSKVALLFSNYYCVQYQIVTN